MRVSKDQVIVLQARRLLAAEREVKALRKAARQARAVMTCIGGPLNDNRLRYTKEQLQDFHRICEILAMAGV